MSFKLQMENFQFNKRFLKVKQNIVTATPTCLLNSQSRYKDNDSHKPATTPLVTRENYLICDSPHCLILMTQYSVTKLMKARNC